MKFQFSSPTRVDLSGGTLDLWPLSMFVWGAKTINVAINIQTHATVEPQSGAEIVWKSLDQSKEFKYSNSITCLEDKNPEALYLRSVVRAYKPKQGFTLTTNSESPIGAGLGGSSSLLVSTIKCLESWLYGKISTPVELALKAANIESELMNALAGTQDYFPAICGGLNVIDYSFKGIEHRSEKIDFSPLKSNFMLVYTGKAHHSGINNFQVLCRAVEKDPITTKSLFELKYISEEMEKAITENRWDYLPELFRREFAARVKLAPAFSSPEIQMLHEICISEGAEAVKICGAGGGGCVMVWVNPEKRERVGSACEKRGFQILPALPVNPMI